MSTVIAVLTTKDGQGSSTLALSLAWSAAQHTRVMLVDCDMSGTGNLADMIALDFGSRGIGNLFGTMAISGNLLEQQAVSVRSRPRLRLVPGLQGFSGPGVGELLPRLAPALAVLPEEAVQSGCKAGILTVLVRNLPLEVGAFGLITRRNHKLSPGAQLMLSALREQGGQMYPVDSYRPACTRLAVV